MKLALQGTTTLLTGASAGIGHELAKLLAPKVARLILVARRVDRLEQLKQQLVGQYPQLKVDLEPCDLADLAAVAALCDRLAAAGTEVDVLINNAGVGDLGLFERSDLDKQLFLIRLNCESPLILTRRLLPGMIARRRGGVLNISSGFGMAFLPGMASYIGSKHFMTGFTESLRSETTGTGVVITQSCPGPVRSEFADNIGNFTGQNAPSIVEIDAQTCARQSLAAFERGRALIIPGFVIWVLLLMNALTPRFVLRLVFWPLARLLRKKQLAAPSA